LTILILKVYYIQMISCPLCEKNYTIYSLCHDCRRIRHFMSIYSKERVIQILDNILSRTEDKQDNKVNEEIKEDIEKVKYNLRKKTTEGLKILT
jgi:hypothetical protein